MSDKSFDNDNLEYPGSAADDTSSAEAFASPDIPEVTDKTQTDTALPAAAPEDDPSDEDQNERSISQEVFDWAESIIIALVAAVLLLTFVARASMVDGDSMLPTMHDRELMIVSRLFYSVEHEDIIVMQANGLPLEDGSGRMGKAIVKRVIGLPGDVITINFTRGVVIRNGEELTVTVSDGSLYENGHVIAGLTTQPRDLVTRMVINSAGEQETTVTVPEGCIFVLGDNRPKSMDSRYNQIGMVDMRYIIGEVLFRLTPFDKFGAVA
jgi:signal peptidase I